MTLLTILQNVCAELSLDEPSSVVANSDGTVKQLLRLAQREGDELARCYDWSTLIIQREFTSISSEIQSEPPADFERFYENSRIWNASRRWVLNGPVDAQTWQRQKIYNANPVPQIWRMIGDKLAVYMPTDGETIRYEYISRNWVSVSGGTTYAATWANDDDVSRIAERILELGVIWRWKRAKGFDYSQEFQTYQDQRSSEIGSDRARMPFSLSVPMRGEVPDNFWPGVIVP
ncbi:MAG TPA: hypothetical protein VN112_16255 [Ensifer sp.]|nr:hypothetical protein [Ensifer sp.]